MSRPERGATELGARKRRRSRVGQVGLDGIEQTGLQAGAAGFLVRDTGGAELTSRAMTTLAARDRAQLVVAAYEAGIVQPGQ